MIPDAGKIENKLLKLQKRKDRVMDISREIVRLSGKAITLMHAREIQKAKKTLITLRSLEKKLNAIEEDFEYNSIQAHQEYVEAYALYEILNYGRIPRQKEVGVIELAYLLGLLDLVGELKREVFEELRKHNVEVSKAYYSFMVEIYDSLLPMRFVTAIAPDFRKKQDVARIQIESVSSELLAWDHRQMN